MTSFDLSLSLEELTKRLDAISSSSESNALLELITVRIDDLERKSKSQSVEVRQLEAFIASSSTSKPAVDAVEKARSIKQKELDQTNEEREKLLAFVRQVERLNPGRSKPKGSPLRTTYVSRPVQVEHFLRATRGDAALLAASIEKLLDLMDFSLLKEVANAMGINYGNYVTELELKDRIRLTQVTGQPSLDCCVSADDFQTLVFSLTDGKVLDAIKRNLGKIQKSTRNVIDEATFVIGDFELDAEYITEKVMSLALQEAIRTKQAEVEEKKQLLNKLENFQDIFEERIRSLS